MIFAYETGVNRPVVGTKPPPPRRGALRLTQSLGGDDDAECSDPDLPAIRQQPSLASPQLGGDAAFINAETPTSGTEAAGLLAALVVLVVGFGTILAALVPIALTLVAVAVGLGGITLLANAMDVATAARPSRR